MKGATKFQVANTNHNVMTITRQLSNGMGTEQRVGKGIKMVNTYVSSALV